MRERGGMHYLVQNWVSRPIIDDFIHPTWIYHKVFEKLLEKCGKMRGKIIFSPLWVLITIQVCMQKNQKEISSNEVRRLLWLLEGENAGTGGGKWYKERGKCMI